jgi:hypothetical protein
MPTNRNDSTRQDDDQEERRRFEADALSRQSNVLPLDAARNEGQFYGRLIRGDRSLTGVQRIGFFLIGFLFSAWAAFLFVGIFPRLAGTVGLRYPSPDGKSVSLIYLPVAAIFLFLGIKVIRSAVIPRGRRRQK